MHVHLAGVQGGQGELRGWYEAAPDRAQRRKFSYSLSLSPQAMSLSPF